METEHKKRLGWVVLLPILTCDLLAAIGPQNPLSSSPFTYSDEQSYARLIQIENWQKTQEIISLKEELKHSLQQLHEVRLNLLKNLTAKHHSPEVASLEHDLAHEQLWIIISNLEAELETSNQKILQLQNISPNVLQEQLLLAYDNTEKLKQVIQKLEEQERLLKNELEEHTTEITILEQKLSHQTASSTDDLKPLVEREQSELQGLRLELKTLRDSSANTQKILEAELAQKQLQIQDLQAELSKEKPKSEFLIADLKPNEDSRPPLSMAEKIVHNLRKEREEGVPFFVNDPLEKIAVKETTVSTTLDEQPINNHASILEKEHQLSEELRKELEMIKSSSASKQEQLQDELRQQMTHVEELHAELERERLKSHELQQDLEALLGD